jgi:tetratricopeptide (TPR) repeat protein
MPELPSLTVSLTLAGRALREENYETCAEFADMALARDRNNLKALVYKGSSLYQLGRYAEAEPVLKTATEIAPFEFPAFFYHAMSIDKLAEKNPARVDDAVIALEQFLELIPREEQPEHIERATLQAINNLGVLYYRQERYADALPCADTVFNFAPNDAGAHLNRIAILLKLEEFDAAEEAITAALRLQPEFYEAEHAQIELYRQTEREQLALQMAQALLPRVEAAKMDHLSARLRSKFPALRTNPWQQIDNRQFVFGA